MLGKVKTRLAKSIGDVAAFEVYKELVDITENESRRVEDCDIHVYFSDIIIESKWDGCSKYVQEGADLGIRMKNAFKEGFNQGYSRIIGIGSDLPDLSADIISEGFEALEESDAVFGPSEDGGYYLLGMNYLIEGVFDNKPWSTELLMDLTLEELKEKNISTSLLTELNDIDTLEDLKSSSVSDKFKHLYELLRSDK